ncbi:Pinoresinol reductase 1 [Penicillium rolfsii]|nr:Pinoresinol reductase 1 [Penicillium rolfsii]
MAITRVAVAGATGNLGPAIVTQLLESGFPVTILSRSNSHQVDSRAQVKVVDYSSLDSLVAALKGHDAVVNTLSVGLVPQDVHLRLVEAAQAAGVQRFLPSEFGCDTANPNTAQLPVFGDKVAVLKKLQEISKQNSAFTWTAAITGPFFDWGLEKGFIVNLKGPSTRIYDGGDVPVSGTTLAGIGRAVAGVLKHPEETKNRQVFVSDVQFTQNKILKLSGKEDQIQKEAVKTEDLEKQAYEALKQSPPDGQTFATNLILRAIFGGIFGSSFTKTDNELLGVEKLSESAVADLIKKAA